MRIQNNSIKNTRLYLIPEKRQVEQLFQQKLSLYIVQNKVCKPSKPEYLLSNHLSHRRAHIGGKALAKTKAVQGQFATQNLSE